MQRELASSTNRIQALTKEIKQTDRMLTYDKEYVKFLQNQKKKGKTNSEEAAAGDWNDIAEDEDIMGGMY